MRLSKTKRRVRAIGFILVALLFVESSSISLLGEFVLKALAGPVTTMAATVDFAPGNPAQVQGNAFFSKTSSVYGKVDVTVPGGQMIKNITQNGVDITPAVAIGQNHYAGNLNPLNGVSVPITSNNNQTAKGYFAFYRYIPGGATGLNWYADVTIENGNTVNINCGPTSPGKSGSIHLQKNSNPSGTDNYGGNNMPKNPGCTSDEFVNDIGSLSLTANIGTNFSTSDNLTVVKEAVGPLTDSSALTDPSVIITGPSGTGTGRADDTSITVKGKPIQGSDGGEFKVLFNQEFNYQDDYDAVTNKFGTTSSKEINSPPDGAKVIVYYAAFIVNLTATTYQYSNQVDVEYEPAPAAPNLGTIVLDEAGNCIQNGSSQSFHFSFTNSGSTAITQAFNVEVRIDGVIIKTLPYSGLAGGAKGTGTFTYTFNSSKTITIGIDQVPGESSTLDNGANFPITPQATCGPPPPGPEVITGDFHFAKNVMNFGQSNSFIPDNVTVSGGNSCTIAQFGWMVSQGSISYSAVGPASSAQAAGFAGPPYPKGMGGGTVTVSMQILSSCGTTKTVGPKSFVINIPSGNSPPVFRASWFAGGNSSGYPPINQVVVGNYVNLGIVHDPTEASPRTPYDPDGDGIIYTWDFTGSSDPWIKGLKDEYDWNHDEMYSMLKADVLGSHTIYVSAVDTRGATVPPRAVTLNVVPPNPVPIIKVPPKIVEGRTYTPDFDGSQSYSPGGFSIVQYIWGNKQSIYPAAGPQTVTLDVVDSNGLHALSLASATVTVLADLPPIPQLAYLNVGIRGKDMTFKDTSYSPDEDPLIEHTVTLTYDSNNNGSYADETPNTMTPDGAGNFTFKPSQVGKYIVHIHLREGLGYKKSVDKDFPFTVENLAPTVDYAAAGAQPQPPKITVVAPTASVLMNWSASAVGKTSQVNRYFYNSSDDSIITNNETYKEPYKGITSDNIQLKSVTGYNPGTGNGMGYTMHVNPDRRISQHLWTIYNYGFNWYFNELNTESYKSSPSNSFIDLGYGIPRNGSGSYSKPSAIKEWNYATNALWERNENFTKSSNNPTRNDATYAYWDYVDKFYRITDLESGNTTPYFTKTTTVKTQWGGSSWISPTEPPAPVEWQSPPVKNYNFIPVNSDDPSIQQNKSNFTKDYAGNSYRRDCTFTQLYGYQCKFQKMNSAGTVLWTESTQDTIQTAAQVYYVTSDNTKVVISGSNYRLLDNSTGASLLAIPSSKVIGIYENELYYVDTGNNMTSYNFLTGTITSIIAVTDKGKGVVSADGKILFSNYRNVLVVDASSHNLLADISSGLTDPAPGSSVYDNYTVYDIRLTEDGKLNIVYRINGSNGAYTMYWNTLTSNTDPDPKKVSNYGILSEGSTLYDGDVSVNVKYNYLTYGNLTAGVVFRKKDENNMYRTEASPTSVSIVKIANGLRTVLAQQNVTFTVGTYYTVKTHVKGSKITVYFNGVPLPSLTITDAAFSSGKFGLYSEASYVSLKKFFAELYESTDTTAAWQTIVNLPITFTSTYKDDENDPALPSLRKWTFTNTAPQKFLDAGDGASDAPGTNSYNGVVVTNPYSSISKVGYFKVDYQETDDPAPAAFKFPNTTFASFQKASDSATHYIVVHRRPISQFTVTENADHTFSWNEQGYDPDRWLSSTNYSTEATGKDYKNTRGVFDHRYSYTSPSGVTAFGKLTRPQETGTYIAREAVADEYAAWSDWTEQTINVTQVVPNTPPVATLTFPSGTQASPSYVNSLTPTVTWNQTDIDPDTTFAAFQVVVKDASGTVVVDSGIQPQGTTSTTASWTLNQSLAIGALYQVSVRTNDGGLWSNWSNIGWLITNQPPTATMTVPGGTQSVPTVFNSLRPTMQWSQTDPDFGTTFRYFQLQVSNEANNQMIVDSGPVSQNTTATSGSWTPSTDLPSGQKLRVWVRVSDGNVWSNYSTPTWMYINRAPIANFDWSPKPLWEGDTVAFVNQSNDPDGDTLTHSWSVRRPDSGTFGNTQKQFSSLLSMPGNYQVTLTVSDGQTTSSITKIIAVSPLTIQSDVAYTELWLGLHENKGHNTTQTPKDFYSGEILTVKTRSSSAPVTEATAWIDTIGLDQNTIYISEILQSTSDSTLFQGQLYDPILQSMTAGLPIGAQTIHFQIRYANGIIKTEDIPINIIGNVNSSFGVHRVR